MNNLEYQPDSFRSTENNSALSTEDFCIRLYEEVAVESLVTGNPAIFRRMVSQLVERALIDEPLVAKIADSMLRLAALAILERQMTIATTLIRQTEGITQRCKSAHAFKSKILEIRASVATATGKKKTGARYLRAAIDAEKLSSCPDSRRLEKLLKVLTLIYVDLKMPLEACNTCNELLEIAPL